MPTYSYKCPSCPQTVTVSRSVEDKERIPECFACGLVMTRVFEAPPIVFKGEGFVSSKG